MLKKFNIRPFIVFDGGYLLAKNHIELIREQFVFFSFYFFEGEKGINNECMANPIIWIRKRQEYRKIGCELFKKGRIRESFRNFEKSVDVTPEMARKFIEVYNRI